MKFLAVSTNTADPMPFVQKESTRMAALTETGVVEQVYLKADYSGAVLIMDAADASEAQQQLDTLPLVQHEVAHFTLTPLVPAAR